MGLKVGYYKVVEKVEHPYDGCCFLLDGYKDKWDYLHCNFFYTLDKIRTLKIKALIK